MANSASYWKSIIGDFYMSLPSVKGIYSLTDSDLTNGFDATFSRVSLESILFYAIGFIIYTFELTLDAFRLEIQTKIDGSVIANKPWWHAQALKFQKGYNLSINPVTYTWEYATLDATKQIVKRVAVRESAINETGATKIKLLVMGVDAPLSVPDLDVFRIYANQIKPAGVVVECSSDAADACQLSLTVSYNPLLIEGNGKLINGEAHPAEDAIHNFIKTLNETNFGGNLYLTKLTDAIQAVEGVVDVRIDEFNYKGTTYTYGNFESESGWFALTIDNIDYTAQVE